MTTTTSTPFYTFLDSRRDALAASLAAAIPGAPAGAIAGQLGGWFAALGAGERPTVDAQALGFGGPGGSMQATAEALLVYRRTLLEAGLAAVTSGVEGACAGVMELNSLLDALTGQVASIVGHRAQAQAQRLERIISSTPLSIIEFDTQGIVRVWNPGAARIFGWSAEEAIGRNVVQLLVPDIAVEHVEAIVGQLLQGTNNSSRNVNVTKDGRVITCQWYNAVLRDDEGNVLGVLSQTEDVTAEVERERSLLAAEEARRSSEALLRSVIDNSPTLIHAKDTEGRYILANAGFCQLLRVEHDWLIGRTDADMLDEETAAQMRAHDREIIRAGRLVEREIETLAEYGDLIYTESKFPLFGRAGELLGTCGISTDITARRRAERERIALQEEVIRAQQAALRELSTPLIPLADGLVIMPLIGTIDSSRAQQVIDTLLAGVSAHRASTAILDITGVPVVDTQVAGALLRAAQAVKLLGAQVILTGIRPEIAQTLVSLGLELRDITTRSSLQSGIHLALERQRGGALARR